MMVAMSSKAPQPSLSLRLLLLAPLVGIISWLSRGLFIDDALIYARYIRNAVQGHGLVFNPGEHVNALTSPLYSYLCLGLSWLLHGNVLTAMLIVSALGLFTACALAESMFCWSGLLVASTAYFSLQVGMETSLFLAMLLGIVVVIERERYEWLPTLCILLMLTRFEGGAMVVVAAVEVWRRRRWPRWTAYVPAAVIVAIYLALNHAWYGAFLPASAGAKFGQGRSGLWGPWPRAFLSGAYQLKPDFLPEVEVVVAVGVLVFLGLWLLRRSTFQRLALPFCCILFAFYILANIPGYRWYFAPFIFFAMLYAVAALDRKGWSWAAVVLVVLSFATSCFTLHRLGARSAAFVGYPAQAAWIEAHAPGTTLESAEIGTLGWDCPDCHIIDIIGLTTPKNADHIAHREVDKWMAEDKPSYVVVHFVDWPYERVAKQSPEYERVPQDFGTVVYLLRRKTDAR